MEPTREPPSQEEWDACFESSMAVYRRFLEGALRRDVRIDVVSDLAEVTQEEARSVLLAWPWAWPASLRSRVEVSVRCRFCLRCHLCRPLDTACWDCGPVPLFRAVIELEQWLSLGPLGWLRHRGKLASWAEERLKALTAEWHRWQEKRHPGQRAAAVMRQELVANQGLVVYQHGRARLPRVLVVDDDPEQRAVCAEMLGRRGCLVDQAEGGAQALAQLAVQSYDLMLLDVDMPEMDGYRVASTARLAGWTVPILACTAHAPDAEREMAAGMDGSLRKPWAFPAMEAALVKWVRPSELPPITDG